MNRVSTGIIMLRWKRWIFTIIILLPLYASAEAVSQEKKAQLTQIKRAIAQLDEHLKEQHQEKSQLQATLQEAQATENTLRTVLKQTKQDIARVQRKQDTLTQNIADTRRTVSSQEKILLDELRVMYRMGPVDRLKLWLNQTDPATAYRLHRYFTYIYQAREQHMQTLRVELNTLHQQEQQLVAHSKQLDMLRAAQEQETRLLQTNQAQQKQVLAALETDISSDTQARDELLADQKALEQLILQLAATPTPALPAGEREGSRSQPVTIAGGNFSQQKKRLAWPLAGTLLYRFGEARAGGVKWQGIFIQGSKQLPVKAVYPGQVIYADTLRGFGLLLILDHGDNYMSLYGNNQSLYKKVGETVTMGEQIAAAGSGGEHLPYPGLYFEIRRAGEPQDPTFWLRSVSN
jgi:septal ring factor EnvC (AmiA/AmiB activator)